MSMLNFANHILAVAYENKLSVSNLELQKVMYFTMREHKNNHALLSEIYDEPFYVWRYGAIVPRIHKKYSGYGSRAIIEKGEKNSEYSIFDDSIIDLLNEDLFTLVDKSRENKFWQKNKDKIVNRTSNIKYKLDNVLN